MTPAIQRPEAPAQTSDTQNQDTFFTRLEDLFD
jgi:hypothetical protein